MNARQRKAVFILPAIIFVVFAFWLMSSHEPKYQGRKLRYWLREIEKYDNNVVSTWPDEAIKAVRHIGTNAIPFLLEDMQAQDSNVKVKINDWFAETFDWKIAETTANSRRGRALGGFFALGSSGEPAVPQLAALLDDHDEGIAVNATVALGFIGSEKAMPSLTDALNHRNSRLRRYAAETLGRFFASKASAAVPHLLKMLDDTDTDMSWTAAWTLGQIGSNPEVVVPALTNKLADPDRRVRLNAASALASFGTKAISALPAMVRLTGETNVFSRRRLSIPRSIVRIQCEMREGGIVRGPVNERKIALVFTGHEFAEGGDSILNQLSNHQARASFFLTGSFLENSNFNGLLERIVGEKHYLGPHSDKHLLYCSWDDRSKTLLTREDFRADLGKNMSKVHDFRTGVPGKEFFLPAYEHYNREIADWTRMSGYTLINYTPGTRSNADYTGEADKNFVSSQKIFDSIIKREQEDPNGLNGFILLLHIGVGPNRVDKFHNRFGELLDYLAGKSYQFVRVDELLEAKDDGSPGQRPFPNPNAPSRRR